MLKIAKGLTYREAMGEKPIPALVHIALNKTAVASVEDDRYYMVEGCGIWAVDFARQHGGEIYILSADPGEAWGDDIPYEVTHAFVQNGDKTVDVRGPRPVEQMAEELNIGSYTIKGPWNPDVFEDKFMGDSDDKPLYGKTSALKLYHGSRKKFEVGTILTPQAEGYVNTSDPFIRRTEHILESNRPPSSLSRKDSVFMVADPEEVDYAGGYEDYIYEVQPIGRVEKNDLDWYSTLDIYFHQEEDSAESVKLAKGYWSGKAKGTGKNTLFEYRAPQAKVLRLISSTEEAKISAKQPTVGYHWTDEDGIESILGSGRWDAGSVTTNPAYRYQKGEPGTASSSRFALIFNLSKGGFKPRKDRSVPWEEWEWMTTRDIDIWNFPGGAFLGFGVRDQKSAARLRAMMKQAFDDPTMFPITIVPATKTGALKNYVGDCTEDNIIEQYWEDATGFAQALEAAEPVSENVVFDPKSGLIIKYDPETDIHSFFTR